MDLRPTTTTTPPASNAPAELDWSTPTPHPAPRHTTGSDGAPSSSGRAARDGTADDARGVAAAVELEGLALLDEHALRRLLATQPVIEQAKGLLMGYYRLDPDQAFTLLRRWSSHSHVKVRDLATRLVQTAAQPDPHPFRPADAHLDI